MVSVDPVGPTDLSAAGADLFDSERQDWLVDPRTAFDAWLASQNFRHSSAEVYRAQWGLFLEWLQARHKNLVTVDMGSIAEFVGGLSIRKPQRARYLRLIERVLDHVREIELASTNPARFIAQDGEAEWRNARDNEPTGFLTIAERSALIAYLSSPVTNLTSAQRWRERRDRALIAVFLGGGIKTGEARTMSVDCVTAGSPWVVIEASNPLFTRRTRLAPFAVSVLDAWLDERKQAELSGELVFPASPSGRPMHKATMLRAVDALVEAAGISRSREARASPHTLRNSFAADLFESGVEPEVVGQWLGFAQAVSANRLHRAWKTWNEQEKFDAETRLEETSTSSEDPDQTRERR
ncbi:tyrosine-type recombinase/integrase [Paraburkholderia azotifigens]|uniref:tyrosine-type recombinase/integrase n=1 Tax=Paraburkholderia azotifigens TaxID=2057004 RepID=UPI0038B8AA06